MDYLRELHEKPKRAFLRNFKTLGHLKEFDDVARIIFTFKENSKGTVEIRMI